MDRFPSRILLLDNSDTITLNMNNNIIQNISYAVQKFDKNSDNEAEHYKNITRLYLSNNKIKYFQQKSLPSNLEELYLDHNQISSFSQSDANYFDTLIEKRNLQLKLGSNPFACDCDSVPLFHLLKHRYKQILDRYSTFVYRHVIFRTQGFYRRATQILCLPLI